MICVAIAAGEALSAGAAGAAGAAGVREATCGCALRCALVRCAGLVRGGWALGAAASGWSSTLVRAARARSPCAKTGAVASSEAPGAGAFAGAAAVGATGALGLTLRCERAGGMRAARGASMD